jgi:hypothetical protein
MKKRELDDRLWIDRRKLMQKISEISKNLNISKTVLDDIDELLSHDEWGIAYETLCSEIYNKGIALDRESYLLIVSMGKIMEMSPWFWENIKVE